MKYSICIPTHNNFSSIKRSVECALAQCGDFETEVLVSDTSDNENTYEMLLQIKNEKLKVFRNDSAWSMWDNHNFLLDKAIGDYVLFIHSDDYLLADSVLTYDRFLKRNGYPSRIVLVGNSLYKSFKQHLDLYGMEGETYITGTDAIKLFVCGGLTPSGTIYSKDFKNVGFLFDEFVPPFSDCISMLKLAFEGTRFCMLNDIVFVRTGNSTNFPTITKEKRIKVNNLLKQYFNKNQLDIICDVSSQYLFWEIPVFMSIDKKVKHQLIKKWIKNIIRHPKLLFTRRAWSYIYRII